MELPVYLSFISLYNYIQFPLYFFISPLALFQRNEEAVRKYTHGGLIVNIGAEGDDQSGKLMARLCSSSTDI